MIFVVFFMELSETGFLNIYLPNIKSVPLLGSKPNVDQRNRNRRIRRHFQNCIERNTGKSSSLTP